jgi:hypothetical protein
MDIKAAFHDAVDQGRNDVVTTLLTNGYKPQKDNRLLDRAVHCGNVEVFRSLEHALRPSETRLFCAYRYALWHNETFFASILSCSQSFKVVERLLYDMADEGKSNVLASIVIDKVGSRSLRCLSCALTLLVSAEGKTEEDIRRIGKAASVRGVNCEQALQKAIEQEDEMLVRLLCPQEPTRKSLEAAISTGNMRMVSLLVKRRQYPRRDLKKARKKALQLGMNEIARQLHLVCP